MREAAQVLVDAVSVGGLYALTALGIGMIFGVMRLVNFAHADLITFAGYAILVFFTQSTALAIAAAGVAAIVVALITERRHSGRSEARIRRRCSSRPSR